MCKTLNQIVGDAADIMFTTGTVFAIIRVWPTFNLIEVDVCCDMCTHWCQAYIR